jgi:hypothetical protein
MDRGLIELRLLQIANVLREMEQNRCWDLRLENDLKQERKLLTAQLARP